ncbi:MAG TPA: rhodanese-like domain-containing protein [Candidatus Dormibacteraeota bacterium]|nr:rhodanese-like domain-containing protein [Candidatus Dormibacteraeota bacterium]
MALEIEPSAVNAMLQNGAVLLDVREPDEWAEAHITGAIHIPLGEIARRANELPEAQNIICMCRSGGRSAKAQRSLLQSGRFGEIFNMSGGILRWLEAGLPVERGS